MKQRIFMYLFVFSVLLILFQYMNAKRVFEDLNNTLAKREAALVTYKDSVAGLENAYLNAAHFNLAHNEDAISYFEADGYNIDSLMPFVKDELYKLNEVKGQHPIVPYASSTGRKMMINTVKMLNHKWIIADFSDGEFWGEVFLTYQINKDDTVAFTLVESFLYPFD